MADLPLATIEGASYRMDQFVILNTQEQQRLLRAIESAVHVRRPHQFFLWAQGQLYSLIPHDVLVCLRLPQGSRASHVEAMHNMVFDDSRENHLCHPESGLAVRMARSCIEAGLLPGMADGGPGCHKWLYDSFREEMQLAGLRNAVVHGHRIDGHDEASFFLLFNVEEAITPVHAYLVQLMLPHLHLAFSHIIHVPEQIDETGTDRRLAVTERELQILKWVCTGRSNHEISAILDISPLTVKNHVQKIFRKLNVHNRAQAVSKAMALKLFPNAG
jgi:transcriptional regulator EpsA